MIDRYLSLYIVIIFEKNSNSYFYKIKIVIIKNIKVKSKSKNKKIVPKIINGFLICKFLTFCLYKSRKIFDYYQNIISANDFINRLNSVYLNYSLRYSNEY